MASGVHSSVEVILGEHNIPLSLQKKPEELKYSELKFWLKCRGNTAKGLTERKRSSCIEYTTTSNLGKIRISLIQIRTKFTVSGKKSRMRQSTVSIAAIHKLQQV